MIHEHFGLAVPVHQQVIALGPIFFVLLSTMWWLRYLQCTVMIDSNSTVSFISEQYTTYIPLLHITLLLAHL